MKKLESSLINMLLVLTGITVVSVALLAYVNELTKEPIAAANAKALSDALKIVLPEFTNDPVSESDTIYSEKNGKKEIEYILYPAKNGDNWIGTAVQATSMGFGGDLKVLVGFDAQDNIIDYSLLSHSETPGLGSKADVWFKPQEREKSLIEKLFGFEIVPTPKNSNILGQNPGKSVLKVTQDKGEIDAITASTITSRAFLNAVNSAFATFKGNADGTTGASQKNVEQP